MIETMQLTKKVYQGLAATQADFTTHRCYRYFGKTRDEPMVLINPECIDKRGEDGIEEGCLSVPGARALVPALQK